MSGRSGPPSRVDPVVRALSGVLGGPAGRRAAGHPWWSPVRVLLAATTGALALGMAGRSACVPTAWSGDDQPFAELCWTELAGASASQGGAGATGANVGRLVGRVASWVAPERPAALATAAVAAVLLAAVALAVTRLLGTADRSSPWAAAGWAVAPVLAVHWLSWDLLAAAGVALLLVGWARREAWLGIPGLVLVGLFAHPLVTTRTADTGSVWLLIDQAGDASVPFGVRTVVLVAVLAAAGVSAYAMTGRRPRDIATTARAGVVVLGTLLLVTPSAPPESALLLLSLAAFAVPRWRDLLVWQACELVAWVLTGWYLGEALVPGGGGDSRAYWVAVVLRLVGVLWLVAAAVRVSGDRDAVERGRGEPDPHVDLLADARHPGA